MFKVTKKEIGLVEAYALTVVVAAGSLYSAGDHQIKHDVWTALVSVLTPVYLSLKAKAKAYIAAKKVALVIPAKP